MSEIKGAEMNIKRLILMAILLMLSISGCSKPQVVNNLPPVPNKNNEIEVEMKFSTYNPKGVGIEGTELILVGYDGGVIDTLQTDINGEIIKKITVPEDERYSNSVDDGLTPRGTITVIAFKEGYKESVLFEAGVSKD